MNQNEAVHQVRTFTATNNETEDVHTLYELIEQLGDLQQVPDVRRELISIFERFPNNEFGTPGPIVHSLEASPIDEHVDLLVLSLSRLATYMVLLMVKRCLNSELSARNRSKILTTLTKVRGQASSEFLNQRIEQLLGKK